MKTLGYYYDQVSREVMTQRISSRVKLVDASTPTTTQPGRTDTVWVETQHPVDHELDVTWALDGTNLSTSNARALDLSTLSLAAGTHTLTATIVDPTTFVRDPAIRNGTALTQKLTWTIKDGVNAPVAVTPAITRSTSTDKPVGRNDVVYVETTHPDGPVSWTLDGATVGGTAKNLRLSNLTIAAGSHTLVARFGDDTRTWKVDATEPVTTYSVSAPRATLTQPGAEVPEYIFEGPFSMKLTATDDDPGYVVPEFRVDGDGWQNFHGWPTDANAPFQFSVTGTDIDLLNYGKLAYGRHVIEYRAIDASGNVASAKRFIANYIDPEKSEVGDVGGTVPATLSLSLGSPASWGAGAPGRAQG
jgi:hypothetical protein